MSEAQHKFNKLSSAFHMSKKDLDDVLIALEEIAEYDICPDTAKVATEAAVRLKASINRIGAECGYDMC